MGKRGGAGAPGLGISGIDLTSAYPRGVWGKRFNFLYILWSNQESIRTGPRQAPLGILPPKMRPYAITKARFGVRESVAKVEGERACNKITRVKGRQGKKLPRFTQADGGTPSQRDAFDPPTPAAKPWL